MLLRLIVFSSFAVALQLLSQPAYAQDAAIILAPPDEHASWYLGSAKIRVTSKSVGGVSATALSKLDESPRSSGFCYVGAVSQNSFQALDRSTQEAVGKDLATLRTEAFDTEFDAYGLRFRARIFAYERCDTAETGLGIFVTDEKNTVKFVNSYDYPNVGGHLLYLWKPKDEELAVSTCFECSDVRRLFYDTNRDRFYWD